MCSAEEGEWWQTGTISSGSRQARSTSSTSPPRIAASGRAPDANASAAARSWSRSGAKVTGRSSARLDVVVVVMVIPSLQELERLLARGLEGAPVAVVRLGPLGDAGVPELVQDRDVLGDAPDECSDQGPGERARRQVA